MSENETNIKEEGAFYRKKFLLSIIIPGIFIFIMWLVKSLELIFGAEFTDLGILPLSFSGLPGIIFSPFVHSDVGHLFNNSIPLFLLGTALFYFYSEVALNVFILTWLITGFLVWIAGRDSWHIGASGLIYGLASFLFFSGIIRKYFRLVALSLLVVFLYGQMVWGIFPGTYKNVSWESHMLGFISGIFLAIIYRKVGPQEPVYEWMMEEEEEEKGSKNEIKEQTLGDSGEQFKDPEV
ncbi:MAG: rhomboid family intramembrane serine protease [Bacteroidales bacterium]|nr:rhomboid family intramembrane serine protease [Bacteroidales bacterium]